MSSSSTTATAGGGSTSMVSAEAETGWHVFKVQGYSHYKGSVHGLGKAVTSGAFSVGGHSWRIQYFPGCCVCNNGKQQNPGWICFGVLREHPATDGGGMARAVFTLSLLDTNGEPLASYTRESSGPREFSRTTGYGCHFGCFIQSATFDLLHLQADCFRIRCDLTVLLETRDESVLPSPDLHLHLGNLLSTGVGADVTFDVGKETFVAHRNVLAARSPVFMAEFFGGMMEEKQDTARVRIFGIHTMAFKAMLHFIYTDSLPEIDEDDRIPMLQHLLVAADRYDIQRLKMICENKLCISVNASVAVTTLVLADKHGCRRLKEACIKLLKVQGNFNALGHHDFSYLKRLCPSLLDELLIAEHGL